MVRPETFVKSFPEIVFRSKCSPFLVKFITRLSNYADELGNDFFDKNLANILVCILFISKDFYKNKIYSL